MKTHWNRPACSILAAAAMVLPVFAGSLAAEPPGSLLEKQDLFEARTNGYWTCRIPGIAVTRSDVVLVTTEARPGRGGDYDFNDVLMRRSTDGGKTFGPIVKLVDHTTYGKGPVSNFVMIPDRDSGRIVAVFHHDYARAFTLHSDDDGATWSKPTEITEVFHAFKSDYPWVVCANGCGHGLQLRNGRMIVPVWLSNGGQGEFGPKHRGHRPSDVALIYSDDRGGTWRRGDFVARNDQIVAGVKAVYPSETTAVERSDGSVLFNMRSESARQRRLVAAESWEWVFENHNMCFPQMYVCFPFDHLFLHGPDRTTVAGRVEGGRVVVEEVLPASRRKDIEILPLKTMLRQRYDRTDRSVHGGNEGRLT